MSATLDGQVSREMAEAFLFLEARLCDESKYDEWSALWTDDGTYWVPVNSDDYDPRKHLSIIYDDRAQLQDRIDRLKSGKAWAQEPPSRMARIVSNIEIGHVCENGDIELYSKYVLSKFPNGLQATYFARQLPPRTLHKTAMNCVCRTRKSCSSPMMSRFTT